MKKNKVLIVGGGGRCHAIASVLARSEAVGDIFCAPGNAGTASIAHNIPIGDSDIPALLKFAQDKQTDLTIVGPEVPLSKGIADEFRAAGLKIFGHTKAAAAIETSKEYAKDLMMRYGIPTAGYKSFTDFDEALSYVSSRPFPAVLKYDGLAAGKGVVIAKTLEEAEAALGSMLKDAVFGQGKVVVEDYLEGPEFSFMCFVDRERVFPMPLSQDHKRAFDGDEGPNTGGMGAYTSLPFITGQDYDFAYREILCKTASAMCSEGRPLSGVLYAGLMKTADGIKVIEFNARFGDPETEVVLPLLESDPYEIFSSIASGTDCPEPRWRKAATVGVVLASKGYPAHYDKGFEIHGTANLTSSRLFHMGTSLSEDGRLLTAGGRVLMAVAEGESVLEARNKVYADIAKIECKNLFFRKDIAHCALDSLRGKLTDGKVLSSSIKDRLREKSVAIASRYGRTPSLAVIMVGDNPASAVYVRNKVKAAGYVGMTSRLITMAENTEEKTLLNTIESLNADPTMDGILVQLPLPKQIDERKVIRAISPEKDVDGFHLLNVGALWTGTNGIIPCTPKGIIELIKSTGTPIKGKTAVVVGRSNIVGKPVAKLLLDENATVIMAHSKTPNLGAVTSLADILVVAIGKADFVTADMVKDGAVVIDVGMNRKPDGHLTGDVDFESVSQKASWITPVPGGVGPMTIAMLMDNTVECFLSRNGAKKE